MLDRNSTHNAVVPCPYTIQGAELEQRERQVQDLEENLRHAAAEADSNRALAASLREVCQGISFSFPTLGSRFFGT